MPLPHDVGALRFSYAGPQLQLLIVIYEWPHLALSFPLTLSTFVSLPVHVVVPSLRLVVPCPHDVP